jgi:hypothetical protein
MEPSQLSGNAGEFGGGEMMIPKEVIAIVVLLVVSSVSRAITRLVDDDCAWWVGWVGGGFSMWCIWLIMEAKP